MKEKGCDFIVANDITKKGSGFETSTNIVTIIDSKNNVTQLPELPKEEIADLILDKVLEKKVSSMTNFLFMTQNKCFSPHSAQHIIS